MRNSKYSNQEKRKQSHAKWLNFKFLILELLLNAVKLTHRSPFAEKSTLLKIALVFPEIYYNSRGKTDLINFFWKFYRYSV